MEKRLEDISPEELADSINNGVYYSQNNMSNNSWKRAGICGLASVAGIATAAFFSEIIVYHPEKIEAIKNYIGF